MYVGNLEITLQVYLVDLLDYILNFIYFSIFNHTTCSKQNVSGYGIQESNAGDVNEVKS